MVKLGMKIRDFFKKSTLTSTFFEDLEDRLIEADLGPRLAGEIVELLRRSKAKDLDTFLKVSHETISPLLIEQKLTLTPHKPSVFMFLGVNGVGKTTTISKVAYAMQQQGVKHIIAAAGDTFRAAASEQLAIHGERLEFKVVKSHPGADAAAVVHDALSSAYAQKYDLLLVDTAGRMHNKTDLLHELRKINKVIVQRVSLENYKRILVVDTNTGQNCLRQAEVFHEAVGLSGIIASKYDGTAKAGILISLAKQTQLPIYGLGVGEHPKDLVDFNAKNFVQELLSLED